jgi:hypothetical protein
VFHASVILSGLKNSDHVRHGHQREHRGEDDASDSRDALPRGLRDYRRYRKLAPGPWFRTAPPRVYLDLYTKQLAGLDPARVVDELEAIADGRTAALCCFESAHEIGLSRRLCHRRIAARWLEDRIGIGGARAGRARRLRPVGRAAPP